MLIIMRIVNQSFALIEIPQDHEELKIGVVKLDSSRFIQIEQTLRVLHVVVTVRQHFIEV